MQFQVGEIIACEEVKKSRKLLCSQVKIGSQVKQIVSGIKAYYTPEEMDWQESYGACKSEAGQACRSCIRRYASLRGRRRWKSRARHTGERHAGRGAEILLKTAEKRSKRDRENCILGHGETQLGDTVNCNWGRSEIQFHYVPQLTSCAQHPEHSPRGIEIQFFRPIHRFLQGHDPVIVVMMESIPYSYSCSAPGPMLPTTAVTGIPNFRQCIPTPCMTLPETDCQSAAPSPVTTRETPFQPAGQNQRVPGQFRFRT